MIADSALALVFFALEVVTFVSSPREERWPQLVVGFLICLPVVWRRKYPRVSAASILSMSYFATQMMWATGDPAAEHPGLLALGVSLYTLVAYVDRRTGAIFACFLALDMTLSLLVIREDVILTIIIATLLYALAWITAEFLSARRAYDEEVAARLEVAEYERDRRAEDAVATERTRIARELHDVVAHAVSVMIVQADGASYAVDSNPALAKKALGNISSTGRDALAELRRTVSLLRTEVSSDAMPQHGTAGIAKVVEMMRAAGLGVRLELTGELDDVSPSVSLGIHRLVQESLTNVLRHAGANPKARVTVRRTDTAVLLEVVDNGTSSSTFSTVRGMDWSECVSGWRYCTGHSRPDDAPTAVGVCTQSCRSRSTIDTGSLQSHWHRRLRPDRFTPCPSPCC